MSAYTTYFTSWILPSNFIGKTVIKKNKKTKLNPLNGEHVQDKFSINQCNIWLELCSFQYSSQSNNTNEQRGSWEDVKTKYITPSWKRGTSCGESFTDHLIRDRDVRPVVSGLVGNINLLESTCTDALQAVWDDVMLMHLNTSEEWSGSAFTMPYSPLLNLLMVLLCCSMVL